MSINKINTNNKPTIPQSVSSPPQKPTSVGETVAFKFGQIDPELLKRLGITQDKYIQLVSANPEFANLNEAEQLEYIQNSSETSETVTQPTQTESSSAVESKSNDEKVYFNHAEFANKSNQEKFEIYAEEYAKNKFLYGNPNNSEENWNALPADQKQQLINYAKVAVTKSGDNLKFTDKEVDGALQYEMTLLQTANKFGMTSDQLKALDANKRAEYRHEYIFSLPNGENDTTNCLSNGQKEYIEHQKYKSNTLVTYYQKHGIDNFGQGEDIMSPEKVNQRCDKLGVNIIDIEKEYLTDLQNSDRGLTNAEKGRLEKLNKLSQFLQAIEDNHGKDFGRMQTFMESDYADAFNGAQTPEMKEGLLIKYAREKFANLPDDERIKAWTELASELVHNDTELATMFHENFVKNASQSEKEAFAHSDIGYNRELNSFNINAYKDPKLKHIIAESNRRLVGTDPKRAELNGLLMLDNANNDTLGAISDVTSGYGIESVEEQHVDVAYRLKEFPKLQRTMLTDTFNNATNMKTKIDASIRLDEAHAENQLPLHDLAIKDQEVNDAMTKDGTFTRYAKENRVEALKMHKVRYEQEDYDKDSAIKGLNILSDWVASDTMKDDPDAQLAMHNELMTSKYSEVQEHVAGNIKNYNSSIQADAYSSVFKSGNQNAIQTALNDIKYVKSPDVQEQITQQAIMEFANPINKSNLSEKFANGTLTNADILKLSPTERREYYIKLFKNASGLQKIALINKIKNATQKKMIYKLIALYSPTLLTQMVENEMGKEMFGLCGDIGAQNKILDAMTKSESQSVKNQLADIKKDPRNSAFFSKDEKNTNYSSVPHGFNKEKYALYPRKNGSLVT